MNKLALLVEHYPTNFLRNCLNNIGTHDTVRIKTALQMMKAGAIGLWLNVYAARRTLHLLWG